MRSVNRGRKDRTHRTWTPQDPVSSHRRGSLVGWTGYTDPALLEENKKQMNAAQLHAVSRSVKLYPHEEEEEEEEEHQGGTISCPGRIMRHCHCSWTNNCHVSIQASVTVISVLTRSHITRKATQTSHPLLCTLHQDTHSMVCLTPIHCALTVPTWLTGRSALTSVGDKDGLILCLHIVLAAIRGRECNSVLAGMKLAVDLGTGPCQHLTESKE